MARSRDGDLSRTGPRVLWSEVVGIDTSFPGWFASFVVVLSSGDPRRVRFMMIPGSQAEVIRARWQDAVAQGEPPHAS